MRANDPIIILEEAKFIWTYEEIKRAHSLFKQGIKPTIVAEILEQDILDVSLLLIHLINKNLI
ncbi:hypothetical protein [Megamonas sp.]|uniref:hypothetical protein n=1 Tax=Megamonas sp. TaxID=2049033 RepID=UPI002070E8B3|nr:hypothetical protein [Megamonas sp.]DAH37041.1 MAG TPA: hypothetical protein [Caudoviricetes sp.]